jgi:SP family arabinose:H+ symporter-like MFS transporter
LYELRQAGIGKHELNKRLLTAALVSSFGGFIFGYDLGALSASTQSLRDQWHLSPALFGLTVSSSLWGTVCGALFSGRVADRLSRRDFIAGCSVLYALAAIGIILPIQSSWILVPAMRFLCGMAIAGFTVACPLYLAEISPIALRGRLVSLFQVQVGVGVLVAYSVGLAIAHLAAAGNQWKWCLGLGAIPALLLVFLLQLSITQNYRHNPDDLPDPSPGIARESRPGVASGREKLFSRKNVRPILLATSIAIFNQLSGVNVLLVYVLDILSSAGFGLLLGHTYTVLISSLSLAMTVLGMAYVDKVGRKPLLLWGSAGMAVCLLSLGLAIPHHLGPLFYFSILVAYHAFYSFSQGTVVWVYLSELFPPGTRGKGQGYGSSVNWIANAILISIFPVMQHASSVRAFYFFSLTMVLQVGVVLLWYPETRGKALGSIAAPERAGENCL